MSNINNLETRYNFILKKIDHLRLRGLADSDPEIKTLRQQLHDILELKKKSSRSVQKVVPRLTGVKTVTLSSLDQSFPEISNKYVILGVAIGVVATCFFLWKKDYFCF